MVVEGILVGHIVLEYRWGAVIAVAGLAFSSSTSRSCLVGFILPSGVLSLRAEAEAVSHEETELVPVDTGVLSAGKSSACRVPCATSAKSLCASNTASPLRATRENSPMCVSFQRVRILLGAAGLVPHSETRHPLRDVAPHAGGIGPGRGLICSFVNGTFKRIAVGEAGAGHGARHELLRPLPVGERRVSEP